MAKDKELLNWLSLTLYDKDNTETDPEDCYSKEDLLDLSMEILGDIYTVLNENITEELVKRICELILNYGEFRCKSYFMKGVELGIKIKGEIESL